MRIGSGKGRKDRTIALNFKVCKVLEAYLTVRSNVEHNAVFITNQVRPADGAQRIPGVGEESPWRGRDQRRFAHTLRHTFGTHHVAKGTSLRTVQETLGRADSKTTSIYVSLAREVMNKDMQEHAL